MKAYPMNKERNNFTDAYPMNKERKSTWSTGSLLSNPCPSTRPDWQAPPSLDSKDLVVLPARRGPKLTQFVAFTHWIWRICSR